MVLLYCSEKCLDLAIICTYVHIIAGEMSLLVYGLINCQICSGCYRCMMSVGVKKHLYGIVAEILHVVQRYVC